jgi:hypothetical protein
MCAELAAELHFNFRMLCGEMRNHFCELLHQHSGEQQVWHNYNLTRTKC